MTDIQIFLMWAMWISVVVSMFIIIAEFCCDVEDMAARIAGLWGIQLIVAIWATVNHFLLWPMTIVSVVIMIIAIIMALTNSYIDFKVLFAYLLKLLKAQQDDQPSEPATKKKWPKVIGWVILIVAVLVFFGWVFDRSSTLVKQGERAVKTVAGKVVPKTYGPELVINLPFGERWGFDVIIVDTRPKTFEYNSLIRTKEQLKANIDYSVTCQINETKVHVMYDKYTDIENYKTVKIDHMMPSVMLMLTSKMSFWLFSDEATNLVTEAAQWILNDQLKADSLVTITNFYFKGYQASPEIEALIEQTAQAHLGIELEKLKVEKAKVETEKVKQEALQTYERLAAVAKANGIDVQIKAAALRNPFVAQYEVAKALQNWNGEFTLPNTLAIMEQASNGGGGTSIFPIVPITTK